MSLNFLPGSTGFGARRTSMGDGASPGALGGLLALLVQVTLVLPVAAQPTPATRPQLELPPGRAALPSALDIDAARRAVPTRADIDAAMTAAAAASSAQAPRLPPTAIPATLPDGPDGAAAKGDLSELAREYERLFQGPRAGSSAPRAGAQARGQAAPPVSTASGLIVFASLGMPTASLERIVRDAQRTGAPIVLRGVLGQSLRRSVERIRALIAQDPAMPGQAGRAGSAGAAATPGATTGRQASFQIDPGLFKRFGVQAVPTVVLVDPAQAAPQGCDAQQCQQAGFAKVSGDVSVAYALELISRDDPPFAALANHYAARLRPVGAGHGGTRTP